MFPWEFVFVSVFAFHALMQTASRPGDQIFTSYGAFCGDQLLNFYGFFLEDNTDKCAHVNYDYAIFADNWLISNL